MKIYLTAREQNQLEAAAAILDKYSALFSALVKGETGQHINNAGSAAGMIKALIEESKQIERSADA